MELRLRPRAEAESGLLLRAPSLADVERVVAAPLRVFDEDTGRIVFVLEPFEGEWLEVRARLEAVKTQGGARTGGTRRQAVTFGTMPRVAIRKDYCKDGVMRREQPATYAAVMRLGLHASRAFERIAPLEYAEQLARVQASVLPCWRFHSTPFTSGIINRNSALTYHRDGGNFKGAWSAMVACSAGTVGGELVVPRYGFAADLSRPTLVLFNGQQDLHGVAPIIRGAGSRISVVYYALSACAKCLSPAEEIERIKRVRTERERKRAAGHKLSKGGQ